MAVPLTTIFSWFEKGDTPTQSQFQETFSSFRHVADKIRMEEVNGLNEVLQAIPSADHLTDENAHHAVLAKLNASNLSPDDVEKWKEKLKINLAATVDGDGVPGNVYTKAQITEMVNMLKASDNDLLVRIGKIDEMLASDDVNLDELREIVDYIKANREQIEWLSAAVADGSSDDKIRLLGLYSGWGSLIYQNQFNNQVYSRIQNLEAAVDPEKNTHQEKVRGDAVIKHDLDTLNFVIDAYDTVTMFTVPLKVKRIDLKNIQVLFDSVPPNLIQLTIKKL